MTVLDARMLERLMEEFRRSMQGLLEEVCRDFTKNYADTVCTFEFADRLVPVARAVFPASRFSNWKVVGWIESLNDLLYFVDIVTQVRQERSRRDIAEQLRAEFREKFTSTVCRWIFPTANRSRDSFWAVNGALSPAGSEITQESMCLAPGLPVHGWRSNGRTPGAAALILRQMSNRWNCPGAVQSGRPV